MEPLTYKMDLFAPRDGVWAAWTTAAGLISWLCSKAEIEPVVGGKFELFWSPQTSGREDRSTVGSRVLSIDHPRLLHFTCRQSHLADEVTDNVSRPIAEVKVEFFPTLDGTRLELTHFRWDDQSSSNQTRQWFDRLWFHSLEKLRTLFPPPAPCDLSAGK